MIPLLLSFAVFYLLTLVGFAVTPRKLIRQDRWLSIFLSPAVGLSAIILFVFSYSRLNFPISEMLLPLMAFLFLLLLPGCYSKRREFLDKNEIFKIILAPVGVIFTCWPILKFGSNWISYVNDDMNNYVLAAMRFYENGFFDKPNSDLFSAIDYSQIYYYFHVIQGVRPGSELYLSAYSLSSNGDVLSIFMSAILSLHFVLLFSTLAISRTIRKPSKNITRIAYGLFIFLPLISLGFLYQLIGQVGGIAIALAVIALSEFIFKSNQFRSWRILIWVLAVLLAAQFIWYPEILPFIGVPLLLKLFFVSRNQRADAWKFFFGILGLSLVATNKYFFESLRFSIFQILGSQEAAKGVDSISQLFPYFLKPHGLPAMFGFVPLSTWKNEPLESMYVLAGIATAVVILLFILKQKLYKEIAGIVFMFMVFAFSFLVISGNGFGSFKMAMFLQPLLIIIVAQLLMSAFDFLKPHKVRLALAGSSVGLIGVSIFGTTQFYVSASTGNTSRGYSEVQGGSSVGFEKTIKKALEGYQPSDGVVTSVSTNLSQLKQEAIAGIGTPLVFPVIDLFENFYNASFGDNDLLGRKDVEIFDGENRNSFSQLNFHPENTQMVRTYLVARNKYDAINRSTYGWNNPWKYVLVRNPRNLLIFIDSTKGHVYYASGIRREQATFFQPEKNPLVPGGYMQSVGRNLLFEVVAPSANPQLVLEATASVLSQNNRKLPKISILGESEKQMPISGRGSTRVVFPAPKPIELNGRFYYQIKLSHEGAPFPNLLRGASNLYGSDILVDSRRIALFVSNISVIDKSELDTQAVPKMLTRFPDDLQTQNLAYSGIYEDGWISKSSYFRLNAGTSRKFTITGQFPSIQGIGPSKVTLKIDGKVVLSKFLNPGPFSLHASIENSNSERGTHLVEIDFGKEFKLNEPDGRPASALIYSLGFN
jgi:hypothetical protein